MSSYEQMVRDEVKWARRAALEQAAKVCDELARDPLGGAEACWGASECAKRTRALLEPSDER
jgi:hypothetical protein